MSSASVVILLVIGSVVAGVTEEASRYLFVVREMR
jgi:hypothetical protein